MDICETEHFRILLRRDHRHDPALRFLSFRLELKYVVVVFWGFLGVLVLDLFCFVSIKTGSSCTKCIQAFLVQLPH